MDMDEITPAPDLHNMQDRIRGLEGLVYTLMEDVATLKKRVRRLQPPPVDKRKGW